VEIAIIKLLSISVKVHQLVEMSLDHRMSAYEIDNIIVVRITLVSYIKDKWS